MCKIWLGFSLLWHFIAYATHSRVCTKCQNGEIYSFSYNEFDLILKDCNFIYLQGSTLYPFSVPMSIMHFRRKKLENSARKKILNYVHATKLHFTNNKTWRYPPIILINWQNISHSFPQHSLHPLTPQTFHFP